VLTKPADLKDSLSVTITAHFILLIPLSVITIIQFLGLYKISGKHTSAYGDFAALVFYSLNQFQFFGWYLMSH
jgi:hypothetical protein